MRVRFDEYKLGSRVGKYKSSIVPFWRNAETFLYFHEHIEKLIATCAYIFLTAFVKLSENFMFTLSKKSFSHNINCIEVHATLLRLFKGQNCNRFYSNNRHPRISVAYEDKSLIYVTLNKHCTRWISGIWWLSG